MREWKGAAPADGGREEALATATNATSTVFLKKTLVSRRESCGHRQARSVGRPALSEQRKTGRETKVTSPSAGAASGKLPVRLFLEGNDDFPLAWKKKSVRVKISVECSCQWITKVHAEL